MLGRIRTDLLLMRVTAPVEGRLDSSTVAHDQSHPLGLLDNLPAGASEAAGSEATEDSE